MKIRHRSIVVAAALAAVSSAVLFLNNFGGQQMQQGYPTAPGNLQQPGGYAPGATEDRSVQGHIIADMGAPPQVQTRSGKGPPPGVVRFDRAVIIDASGFEQPLAASTLFIPHGWVTQGGVLWGNEFMCTNGYNVNWSATSPDGLTTISVLPQEKWETNNYGAGPSTPGCASAPYTDTKAYLSSVVQRWRPGARLLDYRKRLDLEQQLAKFNASTPMPLGQSRTWVDAGEILFAYNDRGRDMRGAVAASVVFSLMQSNAGMGVMNALTAMAFPAYGVTAPNGQLHLGFFEAIRRTIQPNPQWERRISGHNAAIGKVTIEESRKRADMIARSNQEISRIREEAWNSYQESSDRRAREFGELMRGVETYNDPHAPGGTVELSHNYGNAWRLNDGSYVLTNDVNFEPWRDLGLEGRKLENVQ
jgi:hypothetical protein